MPLPTLETNRLILRPFVAADAPAVQRLASAREIADVTANIPHPYPDGAAEQWIATHALEYETGTHITVAIVVRGEAEICGAIGLRIDRAQEHAELGYWLGLPYWNQGYVTEAARAVVGFGFDALGLHRIFARHFARNPASGRVMQKLGMRYEGCQREHARKNERFEDLMLYGLLRSEWAS
jgi:[ribosomal protein S5]-alanine N-acetyltransferase